MRSRRASSFSTGEQFLAALRASGLLPPETVEALASGPAPGDPRAWASELTERGLLTGYQAQRLLAGDARALVLGQYRILDTLGAGGMGRVYKAEHILMRRVVALKVVGSAHDSSGGGSDAERHGAFLREIGAAARLSHPNVVAAFDAGEADGVRFLVMEYVDGVDLDRLVRTLGPLAPRRACDYARQAALALQYAYERGFLHRDVKPANLLLETSDDPRAEGRVKVLDLGLARATRGDDSGADAASRLSGTPDYIAPEVAHDADSRDVRSDLYSLGCTLYYLLTGRVPFPGGTWTEKLLHHQYDAPAPLVSFAPAVPEAVAAVVRRLMAKVPADRYETPADLARALEDWLALGDDPPAAPAPSNAGEDAAGPGSTAPLVGPAAPSRPAGGNDCPTSALNPAPPSAWDLPALPPTPPPPVSPPVPRTRRVSWPIVLGVAVLSGVGVAWVVRGFLVADEVKAAPASRPGFVVGDDPTRHETLAAALAAAADGDTVTLHGDGPFVTEPVAVTGKALTLRAAPGSHPVLTFAAPPTAWQALLTSDRPLALEGVELRRGPGGGPGHLLYVTGASLRLTGCRVTAEGHSAPVVARGGGRVEIRDCQFRVGGLALCAEVAPGSGCEVALCGNRVEVGEKGAAAVSVWARERSVAPVRIDLEGNEVRAARVLSLSELGEGVTITARDNRFDFDEALLCVNGFGDAWRRAVRWHGDGNPCRGRGGWLCVDGRRVATDELPDWDEPASAPH
jgi:serine/threonine-protein kinase